MRKNAIAGITLLATILGTLNVRLGACGDKFMLIGRALKYQQAYRASHPAVIVVLDTPPVRDLKLPQLLTDAGHKVQVVSNVTALQSVVASAHPDLVIVDANDVSSIGPMIAGANTTVLPVLYNANRTSVAAAERSYGIVLTAPDAGRHPLSVVDQALKRRTRRSMKS